MLYRYYIYIYYINLVAILTFKKILILIRAYERIVRVSEKFKAYIRGLSKRICKLFLMFFFLVTVEPVVKKYQRKK